MATQKPLDIQYGLSLNGTVVLDREQNLAVKNASIENLSVTGTLTAVNTTDSYLKDNNILLNSGIEAGAVSTLGSVTGGSSYTQGTYRNVPLVVSSGTAGYGATADIVVSTGGAVTSVTIANAGSGYATNTVFTVAAADIDSDDNGTNFSVPVTAVTAGAAATDASTCLEFNTALDAWSECTHREGAAATDGLTFLHTSAARWVSSTYRVGANRISIHFSADG